MNSPSASNLVSSQRSIDIYFHKDGRIDISSGVATAIGLHDGDSINVLNTGTEYYLYVSRRVSDRSNNVARYRNCVHPSKSGSNHFRCCSVQITRAVSQLTGSSESWLYVGNPRDLSSFGISEVGLPLICSNNQYKQ